MNEFLNFLTSKEIIVVYIVVAIACFLCFVIYLIDKNYYKRKQRHNTRELNKMVDEVNEIMENEYEQKEVEIYDTPVLEVIEPEVKEVHPENVAENSETKIAPMPQVIQQLEILEENNELQPEESLKVEDIVLETMVDESIQEQNEELLYTSVEPNRQQAQEELMRLTEELEKAEQEARNIDLTAYEEEQEENAIISLEELVRKSKEMYESNEYTQYEDEGNEPISLEDLERRMKKVETEAKEIVNDIPVIIETIEEPATLETTLEAIEQQSKQLVLDDFNTIKLTPDTSEKEEPYEVPKPAYQTVKKFERSPVISPIYGIERKETQEELALENTANYEKLDEEIKKTNEFLMTLRELQKNLD